ncbi:hypothetical protein IGI39_002074 [Enterococcus sp. AZ135]|uniref:hypothetical protein n=1 Tax=unclassified Enterococcus TaxID=2608891 RepID=UPI003F270F14
MDNLSEKKYLYEQMQSIIDERRVLTKIYTELQERLAILDEIPIDQQTQSTMLKREAEYQRYMLSKKENLNGRVPYSIISLKIASLLKDAGRPLSNKEIYELIMSKDQLSLTYKNLTMNILPRMNKDSVVNVEKAYRGFWQYRRK